MARLVLWLSIAMVVVAGLNVQAVRPIVNPPLRDANLDVQENAAAASLMGQFRSTASGWLWLRADLYLHNGVEMRPISDEERREGVTAENAKSDGHEKLHAENEVTAVPPRERDFRGIFGEVERKVASYQDMHEHAHNDPSVAMPLYRLMTWIDPQFVQGWTMGGMILARNRNPIGTREAIAFLQEGRQANPQSIDIPGQIGYTIASRKGDLRQAALYLDEARRLGYPRRKYLDDEEREALQTAYRWLALVYRDLGRERDESIVLREGLGVFPDDELLKGWASKARR